MSIKPILSLKIIVVLLLLSFSACAGVEQRPEDTSSSKIIGINEKLVQSDVTSHNPMWCGPNALAYTTRAREGKEQIAVLYNVITEDKLKLGGPDYLPIACTPDAKWIIYADRASYRVHNGNPDIATVIDIWRYEFKTKKREKLLVMEADGIRFYMEELSTGGYRLYPGRNPHQKIEMVEPKWEVVWSLDKKTSNERLFKDFSGALGTYMDFEKEREILEIELFSPIKKIITIYPPFKHFYPFLLDGKNRIFIRTMEDDKPDTDRTEYTRYRCDINFINASLMCNTKLNFSRTIKSPDCESIECPPKYYEPYLEGLALFKDDETFAYMEAYESCIFIRRIGDKESKCLTKKTYFSGGPVFISPDERRIAFVPARKTGGGHYIPLVEEDLYVVEIRKE